HIGRKYGIRAHLIVPSILDTEANRKAMPAEKTTDWVKPEEVADAIHFLITGKAFAWREVILKIYNRVF
ncbi:MAG: SDR family oxidoreductase, partial [Cytophagales bacterium]|nr:SDR family oxidoreductase [Cytophagales bacterium]